ncbi:borealin-2 isoform X2 [Gouania willdenowi]|uniref:Borealin-2-like n=1 Tax=Gouania willdenowi TaxID=441366 RepID=A0A8C5I6X8_GOUWI|nr:borealin-2-like isoform X2 [Gouania willdenowi]
MPTKRARNVVKGQNKEQSSLGMRRSKLALFIQQFEKEAQERVKDLEAKFDNMLATVDRAFTVELMKKPPALQNTRLGDLINGEVSASDVSIALKSECNGMPQPVRRKASKRTKSTDSPPLFHSALAQRSSSKTAKEGNASKRAKTLACSSSMGHLTRTQSCSTKTSHRVTGNQSKPKLRSVVSAGDMRCAMEGSSAHVTVTTGQGQTVSFSEETKNEINWDLLDDVAWHQIQKLTAGTAPAGSQTY